MAVLMTPYPNEILPQQGYKLFTCDINNYSLIRFSNTSIIVNELDEIEITSIITPKIRTQDLSTSLYGVFYEHYYKIEWTTAGKEKYMHYCKSDEAVDIPVQDEDYIINNKKFFWYLPVQNIHNKEVTFKNRDLVETKAICQVIHTPMKWNYWHFSVRWKIDKLFWMDLDHGGKEKWSNRLAKSARGFLKYYVTIKAPDKEDVPDHCYKNL